MSDRSNAWYAQNTERRKARMRIYAQAAVALGSAHPAERRRLMRAAHAAGLRSSKISSTAYRQLREKYPDEFRHIYAGLLYDANVIDGKQYERMMR